MPAEPLSVLRNGCRDRRAPARRVEGHDLHLDGIRFGKQLRDRNSDNRETVHIRVYEFISRIDRAYVRLSAAVRNVMNDHKRARVQSCRDL